MIMWTCYSAHHVPYAMQTTCAASLHVTVPRGPSCHDWPHLISMVAAFGMTGAHSRMKLMFIKVNACGCLHVQAPFRLPCMHGKPYLTKIRRALLSGPDPPAVVKWSMPKLHSIRIALHTASNKHITLCIDSFNGARRSSSCSEFGV